MLVLALLPGPATSPVAAAPLPLPATLAWGWPLAGRPRVVNVFDPPAKPWLSGHRGVDLAAEQGAAVLAPTAGVVAFSGNVVDRPVLTIAVAGGLRLSFEPVLSRLKAGDTVARGQDIGKVAGPTHCRDPAGDGSCLHWGVRRGEDYLDPLQFILDLRPSVLLPLTNQPAAGRRD
ncbi:M23 family metallopeptidase [Arthrobacter sp. HY1533]|uniref:M23 family metallopeptidase n=1 Tax=Arthrobacter sp. HY1533 TaxID=2970919 RepID=UPI0022B9F6BA|nr:M23 family metallopeptidase [Arthrobacter sp. HY1533]